MLLLKRGALDVAAEGCYQGQQVMFQAKHKGDVFTVSEHRNKHDNTDTDEVTALQLAGPASQEQKPPHVGGSADVADSSLHHRHHQQQQPEESGSGSTAGAGGSSSSHATGASPSKDAMHVLPPMGGGSMPHNTGPLAPHMEQRRLLMQVGAAKCLLG